MFSSSTLTPSRRRRLTGIGLRVVVAGVAVFLLVSTAGGIGEAVDALRRMRLGFVVLAAGFTSVTFAMFGLQLLWLGRRSGPLGLRTAVALALVVFGLGAITPAAPAEGLTIANREFQRRGRSKRTARLTVGLSEWFAQRTFYALTAIDLLVVVALGHLALADSWPLVLVAAVVIAALAATAAMARRPGTVERLTSLARWLRVRRFVGSPAGPSTQSTFHDEVMTIVGSPRHRVRLALVSASAVLADAAALWATCHAAGFHIHPELALLARSVGTIASWVPFLPGGLGVVEAAIPMVLHRFGAPLDDALGATIVYRAVGTLLPALAGGVALLALRSRHGVPPPAERIDDGTP